MRRPKQPPTHSNIYFIHARTTQFFKIGVAMKPHKRMLELQVGNHCELVLVSQWAIIIKEAENAERFLHERFFGHLVRGEWFKFDDRPDIASKHVERQLAQFIQDRTPRDYDTEKVYRVQQSIHAQPTVADILFKEVPNKPPHEGATSSSLLVEKPKE